VSGGGAGPAGLVDGEVWARLVAAVGRDDGSGGDPLGPVPGEVAACWRAIRAVIAPDLVDGLMVPTDLPAGHGAVFTAGARACQMEMLRRLAVIAGGLLRSWGEGLAASAGPEGGGRDDRAAPSRAGPGRLS
jgi:hypothetical protein